MKTSSLKPWGIFAGGVLLGGFAAWSVLTVDPATSPSAQPDQGGRPGLSKGPKADAPGISDRPKPRLTPATEDSRVNRLWNRFAEIASIDSAGVNTGLVEILQQSLVDSDESRRTLHFSLFLEAMRVEDAPAVAAMFEALKLKGLEFHPEANFFAQRWGELDPQGALAHIVDGESFERDGILLDRVLSGWASKAPAEAAEWVMEQPDGPLKDTAISGTATGLARNNPDDATRFLLGLADGEARNRAAQTIFWQVLYKNGMGAATNWYDSLPTDQTGLQQQILPLVEQRLSLMENPETESWLRERQAKMLEP